MMWFETLSESSVRWPSDPPNLAGAKSMLFNSLQDILQRNIRVLLNRSRLCIGKSQAAKELNSVLLALAAEDQIGFHLPPNSGRRGVVVSSL
jgi:hypothetical protein